MTRSARLLVAAAAISVFGSSTPNAHGQASAVEPDTRPSASEQRSATQKQLIGWYEADKGRRLTILPEKKKLIAVFYWANGAPTSVGEVVVALSGKVSFKQPKAREEVTLEKDEDGQLRKVSIINVEFSKLAGLEQAVGDYANEKAQTMEVTLKKGEVYCSINWRNNAPKTNGWIRAGANGKTMLVGYKWQEEIAIKLEEGSVKAITVINHAFKRVNSPVEEKDDQPEGAASAESRP